MIIKRKNLPTRNLILRVLATAGIVSVALVAPNALQLFEAFDRGTKNRKEMYRRINQGLTRLERSGLVKTSGKFRERKIWITQKGKNLVQKILLSEYVIPEPVFWDGKWRVVIFDVKEKRRKVRSQLRTLLHRAGFVRIQDSVWLYPYPCDEFIGLIRAHLKSGTGELLCFVAEALESDKKMREHFKLF
jgi:DNA-binding transcriptional regulator PaaX